MKTPEDIVSIQELMGLIHHSLAQVAQIHQQQQYQACRIYFVCQCAILFIIVLRAIPDKKDEEGSRKQ